MVWTRSFCLLLLLAGCDGNPLTGDPMRQPGTWAPTADNDANLRVMVADPRDLVAGRGEPTSPGSEAAPPVHLLLSGKRAPLPSTSASAIGDTSTAPAGGGGNGAPQ